MSVYHPYNANLEAYVKMQREHLQEEQEEEKPVMKDVTPKPLMIGETTNFSDENAQE